MVNVDESRMIVAEEQNIDVDDARAFGLKAFAAHFMFDVQNGRHEFLRSFCRLQSDNTVQEPCLIR